MPVLRTSPNQTQPLVLALITCQYSNFLKTDRKKELFVFSKKMYTYFLQRWKKKGSKLWSPKEPFLVFTLFKYSETTYKLSCRLNQAQGRVEFERSKKVNKAAGCQKNQPIVVSQSSAFSCSISKMGSDNSNDFVQYPLQLLYNIFSKPFGN